MVDEVTAMLVRLGRISLNDATTVLVAHDARVTELLASNNALLERARAAERRAEGLAEHLEEVEADLARAWTAYDERQP